MDRVKTGIPGFDDLVEGGFPAGSAVLVSGAAGTGKTIFSTQFLLGGINNGEKGLYITFEQSEKDLCEQAEQFGWDLEKLIKDGKIKIVCINYPFNVKRGASEMVEMAQRTQKTIDTITKELESFKPTRVVVDSLTTISMALPPSVSREDTREVINAVLNELRKSGATSMLTSELATESKWFSRDELSEFLVDGLIVLYYLGLGARDSRTVSVRKMRKTKHEKDICSMDITAKGVVVRKSDEAYKV